MRGPPKHRKRYESAFGLIELMVALTLLCLLATIGMPTFGGVLEQRRLDAARDHLTTSIRLAREEAINRNQAVVMAPRDGRWDMGWQVFVDSNQNARLDAGDTLLQENRAAAVAGVGASGELARYLRYNPLGESERLDGGFLAGTLRLCPADSTHPGRRLIINRVGRLRSESAVLSADACAAAD